MKGGIEEPGEQESGDGTSTTDLGMLDAIEHTMTVQNDDIRKFGQSRMVELPVDSGGG